MRNIRKNGRVVVSDFGVLVVVVVLVLVVVVVVLVVVVVVLVVVVLVGAVLVGAVLVGAVVVEIDTQVGSNHKTVVGKLECRKVVGKVAAVVGCTYEQDKQGMVNQNRTAYVVGVTVEAKTPKLSYWEGTEERVEVETFVDTGKVAGIVVGSSVAP